MRRWSRRRKLWLRIAAVIWPERCVFCGKVIPSLTVCCEECRREILLIKPPLCRYCGMAKADCDCHNHRHRFDRIVAPFYSDGVVYEGLLRLKRFDDPLGIEYFADQIAAAVRREFENEIPHVVTAVPMHAKDEYERGYNQGELLAKEVAVRLNLPYQRLLTKCYRTKPQKTMAAWQRAGNVLGVYDVTDKAAVEYRTVLLIDDVFTTGATVDECAKMLKLYGAERVLCAAAALRKTEKQKKKS